IELFAWMTDLIRYRLNNVPERDFRQFLKLIGARPRPAVPASTELTFWLSAPQPDGKLIPKGTEVTIQQSTVAERVTFSTDQDLLIRVPALRYCVTSWARDGADDGGGDLRDVSESLELNNAQLSVFQARPRPGDAVYLGFQENLGGQVLRLNLRCATAQGFNIIPEDPPIIWEFWDGSAWQSLMPDPEHVALLPLTDGERTAMGNRLDATAGLNESGSVILLLPRTSSMKVLTVGGNEIEACWVRCRAYHRHPAQPFYDSSPVVQGFAAESIGGMVSASHVFTVADEELGRSDGNSGQVFRLQHAPILPRPPDTGVETVLVEGLDGVMERWSEVNTFGNSGPGDSHFMLDDLTGAVRFGPSVRDAGGQERRYGRVPPAGRIIRFSQYRGGGGSVGNVGRGTLVLPRSSSNLDYVNAVTNLRRAVGGRDGETLEELLLRGPDLVRTRDVAVTRGDFERLVRQRFPQVSGVHCVGTPDTGAGVPGIRVMLVPVLPGPGLLLIPDDVSLGQHGRELCREVKGYLEERAPLTTELTVTLADYVWVSVTTQLVIQRYTDLAPFELEALRVRVREEASDRLDHLLHPSQGGPSGTGWPFGRSLTRGDVFGLLQSVPGVRYVDQVGFRRVTFAAGRAVLGPEEALLTLDPGEVLCSYEHRITLVEP
ncbi:MAG: putative baseplate assembly protein, partial [Chloroflexota bacterium]